MNVKKILILNLVFIYNSVIFYGQSRTLISNPSFEVKPSAENPFPTGWLEINSENIAMPKVHWASESKKPSHGQSYISISRTKASNQVISHLLVSNPLKAYRTYKFDIDASIFNDSIQTKLQVVGLGENIEDQQVLATSWEIDHSAWKKVSFTFTPKTKVLSLMLQVDAEFENSSIALDNISNIERVLGPYDCDENIIINGYSRYELDAYYSSFNGKKTKTYEGKFHCPFTTFYTAKVLYDKYGKWDQVVFYEDGRNEKLLWSNIQLFKDSKDKYSIAASGYEDEWDMYASIIVFDKKGKDMLQPTNPLSKEIMDLIGEMIQNNDEKNQDFYDEYAEEVGY